MMKLDRALLAIGMLAALGCQRPAEQRAPSDGGPAVPGACAQLPFFDVYERAGAVKQRSGATLVVDVPVDVHSADCGAPDCWGHEMDLTLQLEPHQGRCEIKRATSAARPVNDCGREMAGPTTPWTNTFAVIGSPNLAGPSLDLIQLYDATRREALVLLPDTYYFYPSVSADTPLQHELEADDPSPGHTYGLSSSSAQRWRTQYAQP